MKSLLNIKKASLSALTIAAVAMSVSSAQANTVVLKPVDQKFETQACYVAATQGLDAAKTFITKNEASFELFSKAVKCNGVNISDFADKYAVKTDANEKAVEAQLTRVKLVAMDNDASQVCIDAVVFGEKVARNKHQLGSEPVFCNSKSLGRFVRSFKNKNVTL